SIREFIEETFKVLGEEIVWIGNGIKEKGILKSTGKEVVGIDPRYFRPTEVDILIGNPAKAKEILCWQPKITFKELVKIMVESDFEKAKRRAE
ncbi:MAG: GDP-mannose 4,6-dehydratase, partial [Bacteroidales bacterium]|nr:GDP-mannose 4,6-dehydratase [Bacteroidales bacterium]